MVPGHDHGMLRGKIVLFARTLFIVVGTAIVGCGAEENIRMVAIHGSVTFDGENVELGSIRLVPIDGTPGPASRAMIRNGQYRIDARGGVPVGRHRVEIEALRRTGRKVRGSNGFETTMVDETIRLGSPKYASNASPLVIEVTSSSDGRFDFEIPAAE